jgi:hypothetical protein
MPVIPLCQDLVLTSGSITTDSGRAHGDDCTRAPSSPVSPSADTRVVSVVLKVKRPSKSYEVVTNVVKTRDKDTNHFPA